METPALDTLANQLAVTIDELTNVLNAEVDNLYTPKNDVLTSYYKEKARLLADYAASISALRTATQGGKIHLPAELNARIKTGSTALATAMQRNVNALAAAQEASKRVVDAIIDAVKQQRQHGAAYGVDRTGNMTLPPVSENATQAVTLDTRL